MKEKKLWLSVIQRDNIQDHKDTVICEEHWPEDHPKNYEIIYYPKAIYEYLILHYYSALWFVVNLVLLSVLHNLFDVQFLYITLFLSIYFLDFQLWY